MNYRKSLFLLFIALSSSIQVFSQKETNAGALLEFAAERNKIFEQNKSEAIKLAKEKNIPVILESDNSFMELMFFDESGNPQYFTTSNTNAAATISTDELNSGGSSGFNLDGSGMTVHEWDAGAVLSSHQEFGGRVTQGDNVVLTHYHSTHVGGTLIASGVNPSAKGMAPAAELRAFDWNNDESEMASEAASGALVSNHSYGFGRGWADGTWYGDPSISTQEDYLFGFYDSYSAAWDEIAKDAPYYLIVKSAGNDRNDCGDGSYPCDGPYDCIGQKGISKNILTVGAVSDIPSGYSQPSDVVMSNFSSWGPADDGRIKPDIVANGVSLFSTENGSNTDYASYSGTSMASPSTAGSLLLLQEHFEKLNGSGIFMTAASLKALVIHTADEAGSTDGPDYQFGWGLMNSRKAAEKISEDLFVNVIDELSLSNGQNFQRTVKASGGTPLKVTIVWTDEAGTPVSPSLDPTNSMLVNDLDLRITEAANTWYPWKLNGGSPTSAATRNGENDVDNVEVVVIDTPIADAEYTIIVDHDGTLSGGSQDFSIIISGIKQPGIAYFTEDWESESGSTQTNGTIYSGTDFSWVFETDSENAGRVRWGSDAYQSNAGNGAISLDSYPGAGPTTTSAAILTLDLAAYATSTSIELGFWWADHNDEESTGDKVWVRGSPSDAWIEIFDFDAANSPDNVFTEVAELDIDQALAMANPVQSLSSSTQIKFGQSDNESSPNDGISIDDITILVDNCYQPVGLSADSISNESAYLSWNEIGAATNWQLLADTAGFDTTGMSPVDLSVSNYTLTNLLPNKTYEWYVRSKCPSNDFSSWTGPYYFTTNSCGNLSPVLLPFIEDWEDINGTMVGNGPISCGQNYSWDFETDVQNGGRVRWGTYAFQKFNSDGALTMDKNTSGSYAVSSAILTLNLSNYIGSPDLFLSFKWTDHADEEQENDKVWIRGSNADEWLVIYDIDPSPAPNGSFQFVSGLDIDSLLSSNGQSVSSSFQLRLGWEDNYSTPSDGLTFDDIEITGGDCETPVDQEVTDITSTSALLSWTSVESYTNWQIMLDTSGFDTTGFVPEAVDTYPLLWSNLDEYTSYDWYVRSSCGQGNYSTWAGPNTFSTADITRKKPYLTFNDNPTEMEVHWQLHDVMTSYLEWGIDTNYSTSLNIFEYGPDHQAKYVFDSLTPATKYYYRISIGSEVFTGSFRSAPVNNTDKVSFYVYGDHRTFPQRHDSVAQQILDVMSVNDEHQTFVLSTGDLISNGNIESYWDDELFNTGYDNITTLLGNMPFQATMGNHEYDGILFEKYLPYTFPGGGGESGNYYSFDYGPVHIAVIDQYTNYHVGSIQYDWLVADLANTSNPWKIIALHEPGWAAGNHENNVDVQTIIQPLCEIYNVQFVFAGHNHYYSRALTNGISHITTGGGGSNLYDVDTTYPNIDFAEKAYHFCKVDINGNDMTLLAIDHHGDTLDNFLTTIIPDTTLGLQPAGHWPFNEGSGFIAADISGNDNDGLLQFGTSWTTGNFGSALSFDGINDRLDCGNSSELDMGNGDFTISAWVNMGPEQASFPTILGKGAGADHDPGYWMIVRSGRIWFYISDGTTRLTTYSDVVSVTDEVWHHIAVVIDRDGDILFYLDGVESGNTDISAYESANILSSKTLNLGKWQESGTTVFKGKLDEILIFDKALNASEITELYNGVSDANIPPIVVVPAHVNPESVTLPDSTNAHVTGYDPDGDTLTYSWTKVSGPGEVHFTPNNSISAFTSKVSFSTAGEYLIQVKIYDSEDTVSSDVAVSVLDIGSSPHEVGNWPMDEGSGAVTYDLSDNGNDGSLQNGATWTDGHFGSSVVFDGINDKIDFGNSGTLDIGTDDFTISAWVKMDATQNTFPTILAKGGGAAYDAGYWMVVRSGRIWLYLSDGTSRINTYSDVVNINDDDWHHLAAVIDRDEYVTFYVDNVESGTFDISVFNGALITSSKSLTMGMWQGNGSTALDGAIDDVRFFDAALTAIQIDLLYTGSEGGNNHPVIVSPAIATPDPVILPDSAVLEILAYDPDGDTIKYTWVKLSGSGDVDFTINNTTDADSTQASFSLPGNYTLRVYVYDATDTVSSDVTLSVVATGSGPVPAAHWPMDEGSGTTAADNSGNGNDGTLLYGTSWLPGINANAVSFDGVNDKIDFGNSSELDMGTGDFTISAWIKMDDTQAAYPTVVGKGAGAAYDIGYWMIIRSNRIWFYISNGSYRLITYSNVLSVNDDTWHHIAATIDRDDIITFYVDGIEEGTFSVSGLDGQNITSTKSLTMGIWQQSTSTAFDGEIDEVSFYDSALSDTEISALYDLFSANKSSIHHPDSQFKNIQIYPNPFTDALTIAFSLAESQQLYIAVYDMHGNMVEVLINEVLPKGQHSIGWNRTGESAQKLPRGIYIIKIVGKQHVQQKTIVKLK